MTRPRRLDLIVLTIADRCDQRCVHCRIWMGEKAHAPALTREEWLVVLDEAAALGASDVLLTGGEPLLSDHVWPIAEHARTRGLRVLLSSTGMAFERHAERIGALVAEAYVSLDGARAATHDEVRGVAAFARLTRGIQALRGRPTRLIARSTLHASNVDEIDEIVPAAREMGFDHLSFLPLDAASSAFGASNPMRTALVPSIDQIARFERSIGRLERRGAFGDGFLLESPAKLRRMAHHLRASAGQALFRRPSCDAPWWSIVVDSDGGFRPCFFHPAAGGAVQGLRTFWGSTAHRESLEAVRTDNTTCDRCVCPKRRYGAAWEGRA